MSPPTGPALGLSPSRVSLLVSVATLSGLVGFFICTERHTCMAGHMQHPPYATTDYALDAGWTVLLLGAAWLAPRTPIKRPRLFATLLILLVPLRLLSGGIGCLQPRYTALAEVFNFFASVSLAIIALRMLWRVRKTPGPSPFPR